MRDTATAQVIPFPRRSLGALALYDELAFGPRRVAHASAGNLPGAAYKNPVTGEPLYSVGDFQQHMGAFMGAHARSAATQQKLELQADERQLGNLSNQLQQLLNAHKALQQEVEGMRNGGAGHHGREKADQDQAMREGIIAKMTHGHTFRHAKYQPLNLGVTFSGPSLTQTLSNPAQRPFWPMRVVGGSGVGYFTINDLVVANNSQFVNGSQSGAIGMSDVAIAFNGFDLKMDLDHAQAAISFSMTVYSNSANNSGTAWPTSGGNPVTLPFNTTWFGWALYP